MSALARSCTVTLLGIEGHVVGVEAHLAQGLPAFILVGLPDTTLSESRDRVRAAVVNSRICWPNRRITVSLSPASLPKAGSHFDLAVACAVLAAAGEIPPASLAETVVIGELGLDGRVRAVRGVLPCVLAAASAGAVRVVVPAANAAEASLVPGIEVLAARSLAHVLAALRGAPAEDEPASHRPGMGDAVAEVARPAAVHKDLTDVLGQPEGRQALEVCAAGGHNLLLLGPPGAGKTMLAERLPGLLPPLDRQAALEVTAIHSVAGALPGGASLVEHAPFEDPHHTSTAAAIVGGGSSLPRPGAASLAHRGVLFLDEAPEFSRSVLDALRQPMESGTITVRRAAGIARYPARFQLVAAANPCPCGRSAGVGQREGACRCSPHARTRYLGRLSGPLLDRVDVRIMVPPVHRSALLADVSCAEASAVVSARVAVARTRSRQRLRNTPWLTNAEVSGPVLRQQWRIPGVVARELDRALERGYLSARGLDRVLRVAWTLADLDGRPGIGPDDIRAAITWRMHAGPGAA